MVTMFIKPTYVDSVALNNLLFYAYVTRDGVNFIYPYIYGTSYLDTDPSEPTFVVTDLMMSSTTDTNNFNADQLAFLVTQIITLAKTQQEAIAAGWLSNVPPLLDS